MVRYVKIDECYGTVQRDQQIQLGLFSAHMYDPNYNWVVGFSNINDDMVYVPEGTKLIGPDGIEYKLKLQQDQKSGRGLIPRLEGKEKRFGALESEIIISLSSIIRDEETRRKLTFTIKELGEYSIPVIPTKQF